MDIDGDRLLRKEKSGNRTRAYDRTSVRRATPSFSVFLTRVPVRRSSDVFGFLRRGKSSRLDPVERRSFTMCNEQLRWFSLVDLLA